MYENSYVDMTGEILPANPGEKHLACVLLVDVSGSMQGEALDELNRGLQEFGEALKNDAKASGCVDVSVLAFSEQVETVVPFCPAMEYQIPTLGAYGPTAMNEAIITGLDTLEQRKQLYRDQGIPYYRPWMFLLTDGIPTDSNLGDAAKQRLSEALQEKKVNFFPMGIGTGADYARLKEYNNGKMVLKAEKSNFAEAFVWLSSSMSAIANSDASLDKINLAAPPSEIQITL